MAINRKSMAIGHPDMELHHLSSQVSALLERCPHLPADAETATASRNSWCFCWAKQLRCNTFWPLKVIARDDAIWMCLKMEYSSNSMAVVHRKKKTPRDFWAFPLPKTGRSLPWLWRVETWDRLPNIPRTSQFTRENTVCLKHLFFALFTYCKMFFTDSING